MYQKISKHCTGYQVSKKGQEIGGSNQKGAPLPSLGKSQNIYFPVYLPLISRISINALCLMYVQSGCMNSIFVKTLGFSNSLIKFRNSSCP